jgi:alanine racemase
VIIQEQRAPIVGRVCMDMTMVDVTEIPNARIEIRLCCWDSRDSKPLRLMNRRLDGDDLV